MQLERLLQKHGFGTRKGCRSLIRNERVAVNGQICDDPFAEIDTQDLIFTVDGVDWPYAEFACVMLHKPVGYECSRKPVHHPSVLTLLLFSLRSATCSRSAGSRRHHRPAADYDDGQFNHVLSSAKRKVPKVYLATTKHAVDQTLIDQLLAGVLLTDEPEPIAAAGADKAGENLLRLTLTSGKYHQVKRMVAAAGNRVEALHREAVGELQLPADLKPGEWRWLTADDLQKLGYQR